MERDALVTYLGAYCPGLAKYVNRLIYKILSILETLLKTQWYLGAYYNSRMVGVSACG